MQQVEDQVQPDFYGKLTKLLDSANFENKPELKKLIDKLRNILNEQSSPAAEKHDIKDIYPVLEYFLSSTGKRPSDKLYVHCPGLTPLLINTNKEALKFEKEELKQEAETWINSGNAQELLKVVGEKLFYFGNRFCRKDIKSTTKDPFMPETQYVGCEINFMAYMLLEEEHEFIVRTLNINSELASLEITEFEALNMSFFHFAILMDSQKDEVVSECVDYMLQPVKNNKLEGLMKQQTHPTDEITSLALAIAFTSTNNTLIQKLIDVYGDITGSSFTNCLSEEFTYLLLYSLTTNVKQFESVLGMFKTEKKKREVSKIMLEQNSTDTDTQLHAYKALTRRYGKQNYSLLEHALLQVADDEVYIKIVDFLPPEYIKTVFMSSRGEESCLFVRLASSSKPHHSERMGQTLYEGFFDKTGFERKFDEDSQDKIHREAAWESLTQEAIILLNEFLDRFVVTNKQEGAHKCALVYYNLIGREGEQWKDEHGRKYNNGQEEAENLLTKLGEVGYKTIKKKKDWTAEELEWCVETHLQEVKQQCSLVMVFIMAHGTRCSVQGVDKRGQAGREVSISQLDR
ncbi:hypothetical protein EB796_013518 [Bugula neritina]|uniref:Uncharacterized protein n=1 Tax=Bugula neritina TaxID=10212 RepID=A0A7J7JQB9_BUGNE|nr:hypothetical protein EB796_013518 [Bugula neritina]